MNNTKQTHPLLSVENLTISFLSNNKKVPAVENISFSLDKGEILAIVGESGCGKTITCLALAKLLPEPPASYDSGSINFLTENCVKSQNILNMNNKQIREIRKKYLAYIFQEPSVSLNPVFTIADQIAEVIELRDNPPENIEEEIISLLSTVGIPDPKSKMNCYPHELSGGMQQRAMIAMALAGHRPILVADEPTTALDVTIQAQILDLLKYLQKKNNLSIIIVTHNLGIVSELANNVIVMYAGHIVEKAPAQSLITNPIHPYTKALISAIPRFGHEREKLDTIPGNVPTPENYPKGCRFYGRCPLANSLPSVKQTICQEQVPELKQINNHFSRCHYSK